MVSITEFLEARIAEDEALAEACTSAPWKWWNLEGRDQGWADNGPNLESATDDWKTCQYYCTWRDPDDNNRGQQGEPGHEHRVTEQVIGSWGHDANGINVALADATHIAVHDPARVLAECAAKRAIIAEHPRDDDGFCYDSTTHMRGCKWEWPCATVQAIAAVYASHPDYQQEWAL